MPKRIKKGSGQRTPFVCLSMIWTISFVWKTQSTKTKESSPLQSGNLQNTRNGMQESGQSKQKYSLLDYVDVRKQYLYEMKLREGYKKYHLQQCVEKCNLLVLPISEHFSPKVQRGICVFWYHMAWWERSKSKMLVIVGVYFLWLLDKYIEIPELRGVLEDQYTKIWQLGENRSDTTKKV